MSLSEANRKMAQAGGPWFATTHWSVVLNAADADAPQAAAALERLCRAYWFPLYAYVRRHGHDAPEAQDLTQEFFARLLENHWLERADRQRGRFRTFLLTAIQRFLAHERQRAQAVKRGGRRQFLSLDEQDSEGRYLREPSDGLTPEKIFDRRWALALLVQTMTALRTEYAKAGKSVFFEALQPFLSGEHAPGDYAAVAARLNLTDGAARVWVHRLRRRYGELLRLEIAQTVATPAELEDELRHILVALGD